MFGGNMANCRDSFVLTKYDDAPYLSDQLLLPNLANGHDVYLATAFSTSYIFKLVRDLASSQEIESGLLTLTFYVPGDLRLKSTGIARFNSYLRKYAQSDVQVAQFVYDCLQLFEEGGLRVALAHTSKSTPLLRGCLGVVVCRESETIAQDTDYVAFVDAKAGDFNSPVVPLKSWDVENFFYAQEVLGKVTSVTNGTQKNSWLISGDESVSWFEYLAQWYDENPPQVAAEPDPEPDDDDDLEIDEEITEYLQSLDDLIDEDSYDWYVGEDKSYEFDITKYFSGMVSVPHDELERGHVPPLPFNLQHVYGNFGTECPSCHEIFARAEGCPSVDWSTNPDFGEDDNY
jgi:hypothetical protein